MSVRRNRGVQPGRSECTDLVALKEVGVDSFLGLVVIGALGYLGVVLPRGIDYVLQ